MTKEHLREIIVIIASLELGGTETHLLNILPRLKKMGFNIKVLTFIKKGMLVPQFEACGIPVQSFCSNEQWLRRLHRLPTLLRRFFSGIYYIFSLSKILRNLDPDRTLLHFFLPQAYIVGMCAALLAGYAGPKIISRRSLNDYQKKYFPINHLEKQLHRKTTFCLGNSDAVIKDLLSEGIPLEKTLCIYNGIEIEKYNLKIKGQLAEKVKKEMGLQAETLVIVIVANLIHYKGHSDLLKALNEIQEHLDKNFRAGWCLLCVGRDNGIGDNLKKEAESYNILSKIVWLGSRTDIPELLNAADIGILASHEEGFSNAILEGMAASLPMIVTDVGGTRKRCCLIKQVLWFLERILQNWQKPFWF